MPTLRAEPLAVVCAAAAPARAATVSDARDSTPPPNRLKGWTLKA